MIYQNNEQYETDKDNFVRLFGDNITLNGRTLTDLLKQSKWSGCQDDNFGRCSLLKDVPVKMTTN